jgi:hypothetical protein
MEVELILRVRIGELELIGYNSFLAQHSYIMLLLESLCYGLCYDCLQMWNTKCNSDRQKQLNFKYKPGISPFYFHAYYS